MSGIVGSMGELLRFALELYSWVLVARVMMSWVDPDPYNPIVQFLVRATEPILYPIRRRIPNFGGLDLSPVVALLGVVLLQRTIGVLFSSQGGVAGVFSMLLSELFYLMHLLLTLYFFLMVVRAGIAAYFWWNSRRQHDQYGHSSVHMNRLGSSSVVRFLFKATEPAVRVVRKWAPPPSECTAPLIALALLMVVLVVLQNFMAAVSQPMPGFRG